jgi:hypothetical protein
MDGSRKRIASESPPEGPYIIRTGYYFDDEQAGRRFAVLMCSSDQNGGSWLEEETKIAGRRTLICRRDRAPRRKVEAHKRTHAVISFREAVDWGVLDVVDGGTLIANDELLWTIARRIA